MNRLQRLHAAGVSVWLDTRSRPLLESGDFTRLVEQWAVTGATSNPTIFAKAITGSDRYDTSCEPSPRPVSAIRRPSSSSSRSKTSAVRPKSCSSVRGHRRPRRLRLLRVPPDVADDTSATVEQAVALWDRLDRPNLMIKVPATDAGVPAIEELTARGVNVNVTLLFSVERYEQVIEAHLTGLERRAAAGEPLAGIASVASFFVSRMDTKASQISTTPRRCATASPSPTPAARTSATSPAFQASAGRRWSCSAPGRSARCGRARAPRTRTPPTCSTSSS